MFRIADNVYEWFFHTFTNRFTYRLMWMLDDAVFWTVCHVDKLISNRNRN